MTPQNVLKLFILINLGSFWLHSHLWKRPAVRIMMIFGSHVGSQFPNTGYFKLCEGIKVHGALCGYLNVYEGVYSPRKHGRDRPGTSHRLLWSQVRTLLGRA